MREQKHNKLFRKNGTTLFIAVFKRIKRQRGRVTVQQIAKDSGLSRQTFYSHYCNIDGAITDGEKELLERFKRYIDEKANRFPGQDHNRRMITACFIFMSQNREVFYNLCTSNEGHDVLDQMLRAIYPQLDIIWLPAGNQPPEMDSEYVDRFFRLAIGTICRWADKDHCAFEQASRYINQLVRLTNDVSKRVSV